MVNTFVPDPDFTISAQLLDNVRLNKQRLEAIQILNLLYEFRILVWIFQIDITPFLTVKETIHHVMKTYKSSEVLVDWNNQVITVRRPEDPVQGKTIKWTGYIYNPTVRMWYGCDEALKLYINAMIIEHRRRGGQCQTELYVIGEVRYPNWIGYEELHRSHRQSLLYKELYPKKPEWQERLAPEQRHWYVTRFQEIPEYGYIWPID